MSEHGVAYRYTLARDVDPLHGTHDGLFVMLNPSTATDDEDDPTIRRCIGFARRFGWRRFRVVNLFAVRATDPRELHRLAERGVDIVGPLNNAHLRSAALEADKVVAAWGSSGGELARLRAEQVWSLAPKVRWKCLGTTKSGSPRHPLYVRGDTELVPWRSVAMCDTCLGRGRLTRDGRLAADTAQDNLLVLCHNCGTSPEKWCVKLPDGRWVQSYDDCGAWVHTSDDRCRSVMFRPRADWVARRVDGEVVPANRQGT